MTDIPTPQDSGSLGSQTAISTNLRTIESESPMIGLPIMARNLEGLVATQSRKMGGEVVATLVAGMLSQTSHDLQETKNELKTAQENLKRMSEECFEAKIQTAVLQEKIDAAAKTQDQREIGIFLGTVLIGIGIELYKNNVEKFGVIIALLGGLLIYLSRFHKSSGAKK